MSEREEVIIEDILSGVISLDFVEKYMELKQKVMSDDILKENIYRYRRALMEEELREITKNNNLGDLEYSSEQLYLELSKNKLVNEFFSYEYRVNSLFEKLTMEFGDLLNLD